MKINQEYVEKIQSYAQAITPNCYPTIISVNENLASLKLDPARIPYPIKSVDAPWPRSLAVLEPISEDYGIRDEVEKEEQNLKQAFKTLPNDYGPFLYWMISKKSGEDRVVYIGITKDKSGLRSRYSTTHCLGRGADPNNDVKDRWRHKSAEMHRRGVYRIEYQIIRKPSSDSELYIDEIEQRLIRFKSMSCYETSKVYFPEDPINTQTKKTIK